MENNNPDVKLIYRLRDTDYVIFDPSKEREEELVCILRSIMPAFYDMLKKKIASLEKELEAL